MHTTIWITGDQCSLNNTAFKGQDKQNTTVLFIESINRGTLVKYHKHKLILIYSVMRHFANELRALGWNVVYLDERVDFAAGINEYLATIDDTHFRIMEQSEFGFNDHMRDLIGPKYSCEILPHCNFLSNSEEFEKLHKGKRVTMENFYRHMRRKTGLLMDADQPCGGQWNFDKENREPPDKKATNAERLMFEPDETTRSVMRMVDKYFPDHPGESHDFKFGVTREDALKAADDFFENNLDEFGPHQDAMVTGKPFMHHSLLSPYINTCLLHPMELCARAQEMYLAKQARISSVEGFIRQIIGWREFVWRTYWRLMPEYRKRNSLNADILLPEFFWTGETDMFCMSTVINQVKQLGYAHNIQRLMILGNFSLIAGLVPQEVNDWFWAMFVDGYDWVMVPNVIGMSLHADNGYVGTKPYAASANYINKMSDYCEHCRYNYKETEGDKACPFNSLYWDFIDRHHARFSANQRMNMIVQGLARKTPQQLEAIRERAKQIRTNLRSNTRV